MRLQRNGAVVLSLVVTLGVVTVVSGSSGAPLDERAPYDAGLSDPREDSYYPSKGDPGIDVLHYALDLSWRRDSRTLVGQAGITLRATETADSFQLDLHGAMDVASVSVDGTAASFGHHGKTLTIREPVSANSRHRVDIAYAGTPQGVPAPSPRPDMRSIGMQVTRDGQLWTMQEPFGAFTWYPSNDQPSDKALYDITVDAPEGMVGVANGTMTSRLDTGGRTQTSFHLSDPAATYLITLAVGPYLHRSTTGPHGLPVDVWALPADRELLDIRHMMSDDLTWLESRLGRYPFANAGVVFVPGDSAMETQGLVTFGARGSHARPSVVRETLVHELIHQWYGDTVTPSDWRDLWLNEGMAMYLQARWDADHGGASWKDWVSRFRAYNSFGRETDGPPGAYFRDEFGLTCVYYCTAAMFERLRKDVGDDTFWRLVRQWPQTHLNTNADRREFEAWVEARTGRDLTDFFRRWLLSPTWPPDR